MENIIIVGSSGHAKVVIDIVEQAGRYRIAGLLDSFREIGETTLGYPVLGNEHDLPELIGTHAIVGILIAIGDNWARAKVTASIADIAPQLPLVKAIHPQAVVAPSSTIGAGSVVMAGTIINPDCAIGNSCIVNTHASIDHDSVLDCYASVAPGVVTGGNCRIGRYTAIGIGAILRHRICIGEHSVIGAGAVVLQDIEPFSVAYGNPARKISDRLADTPYL
ncbi:transferase [Burkholderia sp. Bp9002]|nr:transferase [Burkholderia sp. Bp9002]